MQTLIQVICGKGSSLRDKISKDTRLAKVGLVVSETRRMDRRGGWTKIHIESNDGYGAINIQWIPSSSMLLCRVVTRGGDPGEITGRFVWYLVSRFRGRIQTILVVPGH